MVCSPFVVKGECIGAIQILNKQGNRFFQAEDFDLLNLFGSTAAMYLKNARLFNSEKKAKDLGALIDIGKQITSTLDLDAVLVSVVNLSSKVIPFDESQISVKKLGRDDDVSLRAISGQKEIEMGEEKNKNIEEIHKLLVKKEVENITLRRRSEFNEEKDPRIIKDYMERNNLEFFYAQVLKDDQGVVGVFSFEAEAENIINEQNHEILDILTAQSTVALRNVDLYNTIPSSHFVKNIKDTLIHHLMNLRDLSKETWMKLAGGLVAILLILTFVKIPYNTSANIEILPKQKTYFSMAQGKVGKLLVKEGSEVKKGQLLVELDVGDIEIQILDKKSKMQKTKTEMFKQLEDGNIAQYKIKEAEYISLDYELELLEKKVKSANIRAEEDGIIISENLEEIVGKPVNFGDEVIKVASQKEGIVQFEVPENSVRYVKADQEVKFKVYGRPNSSYSEGIKIYSVAGEGRQTLESDPTKYYFAKARVELKDLRPGMTGRGKIYGDWQPVGHVLFSRIYHFLLMEVFF